MNTHQAMSLKGTDVSPVNDEDFQRNLAEVLALPPRKQAKWRSRTTDVEGVIHKVQYLDGRFVYKHCDTWITIVPLSFLLEKDMEGDQVRFDNAKAANGWGRVTNAINGGDQDAVFSEVCTQLAEEAMTGNHRSKTHKIKIPTNAGEPVRG